MAVNDDNLERDPQLARLLEAAGREEPPAALDAAILAAARRDVHARPQEVGQTAGGATGVLPVRAKRNWYVPVSIAAVLVMSVSLITLVQQEKGDELAQPPVASRPAPPAPATPEPATAAEKQRVEKTDTAADSAMALGGVRTDQAAGAAAREQGPASDRAALKSTPGAVTGGLAAGAPARRAEPFPAASEREAPAAASAPAPAMAPGPASIPAPPSRDTVEARARSEADRNTTRGALQEAPVAAPANVLAAPRRAAPAEDVLVQSAPAQVEGRVMTPPAPKPVVRLAEKSAQLWRGLEDQPPEKWLERLAQFKRDGRQADTEALLAEFRRRFPDHPASSR